MALQSSSSTAGGGTRLYQQMALAREMGFTDSDILRAFNKGVIGQVEHWQMAGTPGCFNSSF
jgi:hypothetical protein